MQTPIRSEELEMRIKALKKASRKKSELIEFLQKESIPVNQNATIARMFNAAEKTITEEYEPQGHELLGFGKFGDKTMQQVWDEYPSYIQWVLQTAQKSDTSHWRLLRAKWSSQKKHLKVVTETTKKQGYMKEPGLWAKGSDFSFALVNPTDSESGGMSCQEAVKIDKYLMGKAQIGTQKKDKEIEALKQKLAAAAQAEQATFELMKTRNKGHREM